MRVWLACLLGLLASATASAACGAGSDTGDTDVATREEDCDDDGYRKMDGDCNDEDADINPSQIERCDDPNDNNCDGFFNEGCERSLQRGSLLGGSACYRGSGDTAAILLLPLFLRRRRRTARPVSR